MPNPALVIIREHGFFSERSVPPYQGATVVQAQGLSEALSFATVEVSAGEGPPEQYLLVHAFPALPTGAVRANLEAAAAKKSPEVKLLFFLPRGNGISPEATVGLELADPPFGAIAAVAVVQVSLAWEDADPIVVGYPGGNRAVSPAFVAGTWTVHP